MSEYDYEILYINDGSVDKTLHEIKELRSSDEKVNYVNLSRNFGKENAMLAGFDYVKGDCAIIMDADLQHPVDIIPEMVKYWEEGFDDVYGKRKSRGKESWLRKKLSMGYYRVLQDSVKFDILPNVGDFRLLDRRCIKALRQLRETQRYTKGLFCWIGFNKKEILYNQGDRENGKSSFNLKKLFNHAIEGITSFTTAPLRLASLLGFVIAFLSMIYLVIIFMKTLIWGDVVQGFPTLICVILFLGGVQLLCLGIIGEYIGRIFNETKGRPAYIIESYNGEEVEQIK